VKHRSRARADPNQPNLRQVHLMHTELHQEMRELGYEIYSGDLGENITTKGIDILGLPTGTKLQLGKKAIVEVTGLRNPCSQIDKFQKGLQEVCFERNDKGQTIQFKSGIMGIVLVGGEVKVGDPIIVQFPPLPHKPMQKV